MHAKVNVRFAPSPTGALHIGSVRTVLYNYLLAKKSNGRFILRIEDTDQKRFVKGAEAYILESLRWLNIIPDEGPEQSGPFAPYKQSERTAIYTQYIQSLLEAGYAYYAFDTPKELEAMRKYPKCAHASYNATSRQWMKNSLVMAKEQTNAWLNSGKPYVIRLKVPPKESIRFYDHIRGWVTVETAVLDDKVLLKADGTPTYHFANVVDDYLMQITHVIRGEEWLPSTPIHILLYRYLGWQESMPQFVHLPLLLAPNGQGKLSKRHAEHYNVPVFPISWNTPELMVTKSFKAQGYLPDALINFLALLGWNPGSHQELFTRSELIEAFSLECLGKSGVIFNIDKAKWFNQQHIRKQDPKTWATYLMQEAQKDNLTLDEAQAIEICKLVQDRVMLTKDFWKEGQIFFIEPLTWDVAFLAKTWDKTMQHLLTVCHEHFTQLHPWHYDTIKNQLHTIMATHHINKASLMPLLRMALTGRKAGPDLIKIMAILGALKTRQRLWTFLEKHKL